jgi:hypothetical protein
MNTHALRTPFLLGIIGLSLWGCSGGAEGNNRVPVFKVTGTVKLSGAPISEALVAFASKDGEKETLPVALGRTNDQGEYSLTTYNQNDGAAQGDFVVTVSKNISSSAAEASQPAHGVDVPATSSHNAKTAKASAGNLVPTQYSDSLKTPLKFTVEAQDNVYDIELK